MKDLIIHMGVHRTGTTTLQSVLKKNKGILRSHGILYPSLFGLPDHVKIPWWIKSGKVKFEEIVTSIKKQEEVFTETIILSAEDFCILDDFSFLNELKLSYNVKVVLYLKEQSSWLESWYNQHIKWPWSNKFSTATPEFFLDNIEDFNWIDYQLLINRILNNLDKDKLHLRVVQSGEVKDTTRDFMDFVGLCTARLHPYTHSNESLSKGALEIIRRLDLMNVSAGERTKLIEAVKKINIPGDENKIIFDDSQIFYIRDFFFESNSNVAKVFFDREELFHKLKSRNVEPLMLSDAQVYNEYLPMLCKIMAAR